MESDKILVRSATQYFLSLKVSDPWTYRHRLGLKDAEFR